MPNETKHTPGPWDIKRRGISGGINGAHIFSGSVIVARITAKADKSIDQKWADARLIAAALDPLGILKRMTEWAGGMDADRLLPPWPEMVAEATKAIAKAEGREKGESE